MTENFSLHPWNFQWVFFLVFAENCHRRCSMKKVVLTNFVKFAGKHLCQGLFFNTVAGLTTASVLLKARHKWMPKNGWISVIKYSFQSKLEVLGLFKAPLLPNQTNCFSLFWCFIPQHGDKCSKVVFLWYLKKS